MSFYRLLSLLVLLAVFHGVVASNRDKASLFDESFEGVDDDTLNKSKRRKGKIVPLSPDETATESRTPERKACSFFVWDIVSSVSYHWCKHLLKDCTYEGLGGRKVCL
jgi:hypothetical protein